MKKALYLGGVIVDVLEELGTYRRIGTVSGDFIVKAAEAVPIPDALYVKNEKKLSEIDQYITYGMNKLTDIRQRYYAKKDEIEQAVTKAKIDRDQIIRNMRMEILRSQA